MSRVTVFTAFNIDRKKHSDRFATTPVGVSLTKQSDRDHCDINKILARQGLNIPNPTVMSYHREGMYGDFSGEYDLRTMLDMIRAGEAAFATLPFKVRERFRNADNMLTFMSDVNNRAEAISLGLIDAVTAAAPAAAGGADKAPQPPIPPAEQATWHSCLLDVTVPGDSKQGLLSVFCFCFF